LGRELENGWRVVDRVPQQHNQTGGVFSVCYHVADANGRRAFLKALNIRKAIETEGPLADQMKAFFDAYVFERDLLARCRDSGIRRVIRLLDHGEVRVPEAGVLSRVPYLILELADGDLRSYQSQLQYLDVAWVLRVLKHATLAIEQLHNANTAHQDLKPSNVLTLDDGREMKLGDLGRAELRGIEGPTSRNAIPGARHYAPPEQLYGAFDGTWEARRASDVYHLGSLAVQLFLDHSMTVLVQYALPSQARWGSWHGTYSAVLPYVRNAHASVLNEFEEVAGEGIPNDQMVADLVRGVREMTDPDPINRGRPTNVKRGVSRYNVRPYVSLFNRLAKAAEVGLMTAARK